MKDKNIKIETIDHLLTYTEGLLNHIFWFKQDFNIQPSKEHFGTAINSTDISSRKNDFLKELINTVASWVYSKKESKKIIDERFSKTDDIGNASTFLTTQAFAKFRPGYPQGQFGELLLFNFIQYFFKAVPLLRKQRILTSAGHERYGADAIHFKKENGGNIFFLGESKCYKSKYKFKEAFKISLNSIIKTFNSFNEELDYYTYDDFIEPELEDIVKSYKEGTLTNVHFELVCLIAYNESKEINGYGDREIKESIKAIIEDRCNSLDENCFLSIEKQLLQRINYIIFPIWELDTLLKKFEIKVGSQKMNETK